MKTQVKTLILFTISVLGLTSSNAQLPISINGKLAQDIRKVIEDYPNRFSSMIGEMIVQNPQSTEFQCTYKVQGAEESTITRYSSKASNVYSWQALMLSTEEFPAAKKEFKRIFSQLNNLAVTPGSRTYKLKAGYEEPKEEMKFTSIVFEFSPSDDSVKKLKAEVSLLFELTEWKVKLSVYHREREDEERGKTVEE